MATTAMDYENANGDRFEGELAHLSFNLGIQATTLCGSLTFQVTNNTAHHLHLTQTTVPATIVTVVRHLVAMMDLTILDGGLPPPAATAMAMSGKCPTLELRDFFSASHDNKLIGCSSSAMKDDSGSKGDNDDSVNPGSNLFVTGIHPKLSEEEITRLFEKYGEVEKAQIMRDPHTKESRGFGFVKMVTSDQAEAARDALQGEQIEGRTLSIEKARRARPRTPTPGKYFGPPKRGKFSQIWSAVRL
jgi:hypothetical protein